LATFSFADSKPPDRSGYPNRSYAVFLFFAKGLSICFFILTTSLLVLTSCSNELLAVTLVSAFAGLFHVMLLRKAADNPLPSQIVYEPQPLALSQNDGSEEYEIEKILNHAFLGNKHKTLKLLVKWKNYTKPTWESDNEFKDTKAYDEYLAYNDVSKPSVRFRRG
jgi:hypothetical protein